MKRMLMYLFIICLALAPLNGFATMTQEDPDYWLFHTPQAYDLTYEEALVCIEESMAGAKELMDFYTKITEESVVTGIFLHRIGKTEGEIQRDWIITFRPNGSPYVSWKFIVESPSGHVSLFPGFYYSKELPIMTDMEAIEKALPILFEQSLIPLLPENITLHHYEVEDVPPEQYAYYWGYLDCRMLPVHVYFTNDENVLSEHLYYIQIFAYDTFYQLQLFDSDDIANWRLNSPVFYCLDLGVYNVRDIYQVDK